MAHWEVEQKFQIEDPSGVQRAFKELDVHFGPPVTQSDHYFNHPARDFGQTDEALRIRDCGGQILITYKGPKIDRETKTRRELELPLHSGDGMTAKYAELLRLLGFRFVATVRKTRRSASLNWQDRSFEVALDDVDELGTFLELETSADDQHRLAAQAALQSLAGRLELTQVERRSYLELLVEKQQPTSDR